MNKYVKEDLSPEQAYQRRDDEQREHLFDLLNSYQFETVSDLSYPSRLAFEKWHDTEQIRVEPWFGEPVTSSESALALAKILNARKLDRQECLKWLDDNKNKLTPDRLPELADMLMQLVHETRLIAVSDSMRTNSDSKVATTKEKLRAVGKRWLEYQAGKVDGKKHKKNTAAPLIALEFHLTPKRIREVYLARIETNLDAFPDGVDAARRELGLLP